MTELFIELHKRGATLPMHEEEQLRVKGLTLPFYSSILKAIKAKANYGLFRSYFTTLKRANELAKRVYNEQNEKQKQALFRRWEEVLARLEVMEFLDIYIPPGTWGQDTLELEPPIRHPEPQVVNE